MDKIKTQDVWIAVDVNERLPIRPTKYPESYIVKKENSSYLCSRLLFANDEFDNVSGKVTHWLEKHTDMVVLTKEEFEKAIADAFNAGRWFQQKYPNSQNVTEYLNNLFNPTTKP